MTADTVVKITGNQTLYAHWNYTGGVSTTTTYTNITGPINLWVGETRIDGSSAGGSGDIRGVESVSYDASTETYTLVLHGYSYEGEGYQNSCIYFGGKGGQNETLVIELNGDTILKHTRINDQRSAGIDVVNANLTIKGDGILNITTGKCRNTYGIEVGKVLKIDGGVIDVTADQAENYALNSVGLFFGDYLMLNGGTITARGYTQAVDVSTNSQYKNNPVHYDPKMSFEYRLNYDGSGVNTTMPNGKHFHAAPKTN